MPQTNIADQIEARACEKPWAVACIDGGRPLSFARIDAAVHLASAQLRGAGVGPGTVVGTTLGQSALHLVVVLAVARLGAVSVALRPPLPLEARAAVAQRHRVQLAIREPDLPATPGVGELLVDGSLLEAAAGAVHRVESAQAAGRSWRLALSSGTTGVPKAVAVTHRSLEVSAWLYRGTPSIAGGRRHLLFLDLNAPVSLNMALRRLIVGDTVILVPSVSPDDFFEAVDRYGVDGSRVSPYMLGMLADGAPGDAPRCPGLEITVTGGALPSSLRERAANRLTDRLLVSYGSTETGTLAIAPDGMLMLAGRADEMLNVGGRKVNAVEVDDALVAHPDVAEAAAFVTQTPSGRPVLVAAVVSRGAFDEQALVSHCREHLGSSAPHRVFAVPSLPRNATGKILRGRLSASVRSGGAS